MVIVHAELAGARARREQAKLSPEAEGLFDAKKRYDLHFSAGGGHLRAVTPVRRLDSDWYVFLQEGTEVVVNLRLLESFSETAGK